MADDELDITPSAEELAAIGRLQSERMRYAQSACKVNPDRLTILIVAPDGIFVEIQVAPDLVDDQPEAAGRFLFEQYKLARG